jgi:hypothetical protein
MKFMLLCYDDDVAWDKAGAAALTAAMQEAVQLTHEIDAKGQYVDAAPSSRFRRPPASAFATAGKS